VRALTIALAVAGLLIAAAGVGAGWEIHRLDRDVRSLRGQVASQAAAKAAPDPRLTAALKQLKTLKDDHRRQEFYAPLYVAYIQYRTAVLTHYSTCSAAGDTWRKYVDSSVKDLEPAVRRAVRRDDPDFHATLLNAFTC
jgi:hypothetical protein